MSEAPMPRLGGTAALICGATYVFGFVVLLTILAPSGYGSTHANPEKIVAFVVDHVALMTFWNSLIYIVNGLALMALAWCLQSIFRPSPAAGLTGYLGLAWSAMVIGAGMVGNVAVRETAALHRTDPEAAVALWRTLSAVENGLGGGNEVLGGVWIISVSVVSIGRGILPKMLRALGVIIGVAGLFTIMPAAADLGGAVFGLGFIVWFFWIGVVLLRHRTA